jgi:CRP-like cAMP-binding protein
VIKQGESGDKFYIVIEGEALVSKILNENGKK